MLRPQILNLKVLDQLECGNVGHFCILVPSMKSLLPRNRTIIPNGHVAQWRFMDKFGYE